MSSRAAASIAGPLSMAGAGTPYSVSIRSADRARREEAAAADLRMCESVIRMARRLRPRGFVIVDDSESLSISVVSWVDDDDLEAIPGEEVAEEEEARRSCAGWGITPAGKDAANSIGSSLHFGYISEPFPYEEYNLVHDDLAVLKLELDAT